MTLSVDRPDPSRFPRLLGGILLATVMIAAALTFAVTSGGCSKAPVTPQDPTSQVPKGKPWEVAWARLKKGTDIAATKAALVGLTNDLASDETARLTPLSPEALNKLGALVPLSDTDREEIRGTAFSSHDPVYLADCLYMRDAARSLALTGLPPERQAELAFAWVCRQVYLNPWVYQGIAITLPPTTVLRRGYGSGLERMYVFLALLQQLDLDGCLIGGPEAGKQLSVLPVPTPDMKSLFTGAPRGPFWAVGVRVGNDVKLFDPWRAEPFPVTFNQLKTKSDAAKAWFTDKANVSGATYDDATKSTVYLAAPVNALSTRMAAFDANLKGELGVRTALDPAALQARFPDPKPAFWNPSDDPFTYGRTARSFLPLEEGGADRTPQGPGRLYEAHLREQIPPSVFIRPAELESEEAILRLASIAFGSLKIAFLDAPNPRERIQRGQFQDAAKDLVGKQEGFANGLERLRNNKDTDKQIKDWCVGANTLYSELGLARLNKDKEREAQAMVAIDNHWRGGAAAQLLIDRASAEMGHAEASFLLALCKHEQGERAQARLERAGGADTARLKADAIDAWRNALSSWKTYEQLANVQRGFPGRLEHAKALTARAEKLARGDEKKSMP